MPNQFIFVEKHGGRFIPFDQKALTSTYEKQYLKPFEGACAGVVAALLELLLSHPRPNLQFFESINVPKAPSPQRCILWQQMYERNAESFFTVFIRQELGIKQSELVTQEGFIATLDEVLKIMTPNGQDKDIILINAIYELTVDEQIYTQDHKMCLLRLNNHYIFCEPNNGMAIFTKVEALRAWINEETKTGSLDYFTSPVKKRMIIADNKMEPTGLKEGYLFIKSLSFEYFSTPQYTYKACL